MAEALMPLSPLQSPGNAAMNEKRIALLDCFRGIAILLVVCFHYFSRWTPPRDEVNRYPYGDLLSTVPLFNYGYMGVELFFIISGFVIALTLLNTEHWPAFVARRFARLYPAMLLASLLTYACKLAFPALQLPFSATDLLPGLTFIQPEVWQAVFGHTVRSMDGPYWSLYVEVKFYLWTAVLYYAGGRERFLLHFTLFFTAVMSQIAVNKLIAVTWWMPMARQVFTFDYLPWFALGVGFFFLRSNPRNRLALVLTLEAVCVLLVIALRWRDSADLPFHFVFFALFAVLVFREHWLQWLAWKPLASLGAASYSLYLLHLSIGLTLINLASSALGLDGSAQSVWIAFAVLALMAALSLLVYRLWEIPARKWLMQVFDGYRTARQRR